MDIMIRFCLVILVSLTTVVQAQPITVSPYCHASSSSCVRLSTLSVPSSGNVSLILLPGVHVCNQTCKSSLSTRGRASFSITGTPKKTVVSCTTSSRFDTNAELSSISSVLITGITFEGCNINVIRSNNTVIRDCVFDSGNNGALHFQSSLNIRIDRSSFTNNSETSFDSVIDLSSSTKFAITRSNFSDNYADSFSAIIGATDSTGFVSCCNFYNNSADSFGGIIKAESRSIVFITNSSFTENQIDAFGGVVLGDSGSESLTIISCVFALNIADSFGGAVNIESGSADIYASNFSSNRAGSFGGSIVARGPVNVDCTHFYNNSVLHRSSSSSRTVSVKNTSECAERFVLGSAGICRNIDCEVCQPPEVNLAMEFTEYRIQENIRLSNYALQVCAVAADVFYNIEAVIEVFNGTAEDGVDFLQLDPECSILRFIPKDGIQKHCAYIEILDDAFIEETEQFTVKLSSNNPLVTLTTAAATVFIVDDDGEPVTTQSPTTTATTLTIATTTATTSTTAITEATTGNVTVLVECGIFSRLITFHDSGHNLENLKDAIAKTFSFTGLESEDIALLQIKLSEESFQGHFIDVIGNKITRIERNSIIRVVPYSRNPGICRI